MFFQGLPRLVVALILSALLSAVGCGKGIDNSTHAPAIRTLTTHAAPPWVDRSPLGQRLWKVEQAFYQSRQYLPAWVDGVETTPHWKDLIQQLKYSAVHGLDPARYRVAEFETLREQSQDSLRGTQFPIERVPELDAKMTYAYLQYAADLLGWSHNPREVHRNWLADSKKVDLAARLADAVANNHVRASLEDLAPTHPQYKGLQAALALENLQLVEQGLAVNRTAGGNAHASGQCHPIEVWTSDFEHVVRLLARFAGSDVIKLSLEDLIRAETIESVRKAVLSLPAKYREVVVLCELQDVSYGETAEILGCAIGTVRSRLHRARALLLAKLRPVGEFEEAGSATVKSARCFA